MGEHGPGGGTDEAEAAAGEVDSEPLGGRPVEPPHPRLWRHRGWHIEEFHEVPKSGGRAEPAKLRATARLSNLRALVCAVGWRVFWRTMAARAAPNAAPGVAFTPAEVAVLDRGAGGPPLAPERTVAHYLREVARRGGYLARAHDPPPGNWVVW